VYTDFILLAIRAISHQFAQRQTAIRWLEWLHRKQAIALTQSFEIENRTGDFPLTDKNLLLGECLSGLLDKETQFCTFPLGLSFPQYSTSSLWSGVGFGRLGPRLRVVSGASVINGAVTMVGSMVPELAVSRGEASATTNVIPGTKTELAANPPTYHFLSENLSPQEMQ
jgi:hypothetical protein